jgi:hypothetical protein
MNATDMRKRKRFQLASQIMSLPRLDVEWMCRTSRILRPPSAASIHAASNRGVMLKAVAAMKWPERDRIVAGSRVQSSRQTCHFCGAKLFRKTEHNCQARDRVEGGLRGAVLKKRSPKAKP